MSKSPKSCNQCREETHSIWIETPGNTKVDNSVTEDYLCERCYTLIAINHSGAQVKGNQYKGEDSVEFAVFV
jgi:fructose-specific phosphotransferase system component IIB